MVTDSIAPENDFAAPEYAAQGGFREFSSALFAYSETWIKFPHRAGVRPVPGPNLLWRNDSGSVGMHTATAT